MKYNTQRGDIQYREYGRVMKNVIDRVCQLENSEERVNAARAAVETMFRIGEPGMKDGATRHKIWDHLMVMSEFKLEDAWPYDASELEALRQRVEHKNERPKERLQYSSRKITRRHYGVWLEEMMQKLKDVKDESEFEELAKLVARQAKRSYLVWNGDVTNDNMIVDQIADTSEDDRVQPLLRDHPIVVPFNSLPLDEQTKKKKNKKKK